MKEFKDMSYIERLEESMRILLKDIIYNNEYNLDNTYNYEIYEQLSTELDLYYNVY